MSEANIITTFGSPMLAPSHTWLAS